MDKVRIFICVALLFLMNPNSGGFLILDGSNQSLEERLLKLEAEFVLLRNELKAVEVCTSDFCEIHWSKWSAWSGWSQCTGQCNQGYGASEQTRTRTRTCLNQEGDIQVIQCTGDKTETDKRACNAVELYGCLSGQNTNTTYGMVYNFFDELAQSACTAAVTSPSHVLALRRNCDKGNAPQCATICSNAGYTCFDELHVYPPHNVLQPNVYTDEGKPGLMMYRYFSCTWSNGQCGPNYCCCQYA